jgi:hypothetical protein
MPTNEILTNSLNYKHNIKTAIFSLPVYILLFNENYPLVRDQTEILIQLNTVQLLSLRGYLCTYRLCLQNCLLGLTYSLCINFSVLR